MIKAVLFALLFAQSTWTHLPGSNSKQARRLKAALQAPVQDYELSATNFVDALIDLAGRFKTPMGIEWVRTPPATKRVRMFWKRSTVRNVIQDVVRSQRGYEVRVGNAVVHVRPRDAVVGRENFLNIPVPQLQSDGVAEMVSRRLNQDATSVVAPPKPKTEGGVGLEMAVEMDDPDISIDLRNASVEDILDCIALASPFKIWLVTFAGSGNVTRTGFRRTLSPLTGKAIPDEYQPYWELLRWGRTPY